MRKINSFHFNRIKNFLFLFASTDRRCRARTMVMGIVYRRPTHTRSNSNIPKQKGLLESFWCDSARLKAFQYDYRPLPHPHTRRGNNMKYSVCSHSVRSLWVLVRSVVVVGGGIKHTLNKYKAMRSTIEGKYLHTSVVALCGC